MCAYYRLNITTVTICRWCEVGIIPYQDTWPFIPNDLTAKLTDKYHALFRSSSSAYPLTPKTLLERTIRLINFIGLNELSPLNAPLVAKGFIMDLGLPDDVWSNYISITKILEPCSALRGFEAYGEYHIENIISLVIVACKMCKNWILWSLVSNKLVVGQDDTFSGARLSDYLKYPVNVQELDHVPRLFLIPLLTQFRRAVPSAEIPNNHNKILNYLF